MAAQRKRGERLDVAPLSPHVGFGRYLFWPGGAKPAGFWFSHSWVSPLPPGHVVLLSTHWPPLFEQAVLTGVIFAAAGPAIEMASTSAVMMNATVRFTLPLSQGNIGGRLCGRYCGVWHMATGAYTHI
jgi:hypothetical protein